MWGSTVWLVFTSVSDNMLRCVQPTWKTGGDMFLWNTSKYLSDHMVSHPGRHILHEYKTLLSNPAKITFNLTHTTQIHGLDVPLSDACFSISSSFRCLRILESIPSRLVVFFLALPLGPPSPVLLGVNFGADISSIKSKSDFSSGLQHENTDRHGYNWGGGRICWNIFNVRCQYFTFVLTHEDSYSKDTTSENVWRNTSRALQYYHLEQYMSNISRVKQRIWTESIQMLKWNQDAWSWGINNIPMEVCSKGVNIKYVNVWVLRYVNIKSYVRKTKIHILNYIT